MFYLKRCLPIIHKQNLTWKKTRILKQHFCSEKDNKNNQSGKNKLPAIRSPFETAEDKSKTSFLDLVTIFESRDVHRRNHVEFIYAALRSMESFGVKNDIEVYKALINVMPKGKFIPTNIFQAEFMHYPKQQQCIIDLLEQMEDFGVMPDYEMEAMLLNIFGRRGHPLRKYWRMMYWMPKFKNLSPWSLPNPVPSESFELAKLAITRMSTVDLLSKVEVFETKDVKDAIDLTWIVSGMSCEQSNLLLRHDQTKSLFIEGPFLIWLKNKSVNYFTLRADPNPADELKEPEKKDTDDVRKIKVPFFGQPPVKESKLSTNIGSVHQQDDGTIFAICATGTSTKDSLLSWIRILENNGNSVLGKIPILFKFRSNIESNLVPILNESPPTQEINTNNNK